MHVERRRLQRKSPRKLSYIQFEGGNGGLVLNVSEYGMAFQSVYPVEHHGIIGFSISPSPEQQIQATADVVWMDQAKRVGGLRFTDLSAFSRQQIDSWLRQIAKSATNADNYDALLRRAQNDSGLDRGEQEGIGNPVLNPDLGGVTASARADVSTGSTSSLRTFPPSASLPGAELSGQGRPFSQSRTTRYIATVFLICVFTLMFLVFIQNFRPEIGDSLIRFGETLKSGPPPPAELPPAPPAARQTGSPGSPNLGPETPSLSEHAVLKSPSQAKPDLDSANLKPMRPNGDSFTRKQTFSERQANLSIAQLWSAVANGDTASEVVLAKRYLRGDGVARNCQQARVLLRAAVKRGDAEAMAEFVKLNREGCRAYREAPGNSKRRR
jgi:hypothetical protein